MSLVTVSGPGRPARSRPRQPPGGSGDALDSRPASAYMSPSAAGPGTISGRLTWPGGRVVMQGTANPRTSVRFRSGPPLRKSFRSIDNCRSQPSHGTERPARPCRSGAFDSGVQLRPGLGAFSRASTSSSVGVTLRPETSRIRRARSSGDPSDRSQLDGRGLLAGKIPAWSDCYSPGSWPSNPCGGKEQWPLSS